MTWKMQVRTTAGGSLTEIDLRSSTYYAENFRLSIAYGQPARLSWTCRVPQHLQPIPEGAYIVAWDDGANDNAGTPFSSGNPTFVGWVETPIPGQTSRAVEYTAYDPTYRASKHVTVFDAPYEEGEPAEPAEDSVPRLVYNVRISSDPDWAIQVGGDGTLGEIISGLLEYTVEALRNHEAAPATGDAYDSADMSAMTHKPQEKMDFQSEGVFSAVERCQRYDPRIRCLFDPASKLWRFRNIVSAPAVTLQVNDPGVDHLVLSLQIQPSTENCVTAVSVYGPPSPGFAEFEWSEDTGDTDTLEPITSPIVLETYTDAGGSHDVVVYQTFQIVDPEQRRGQLRLAEAELYDKAPNLFGETEVPLLLCSFDEGITWIEWYQTRFDYKDGKVTFIGSPPQFKVVDQSGGGVIPGSTQTIFAPTNLKLLWAPYEEPLKVRRPASGYEGTAFSVAGLEREYYQYDEALAVGREYGTPVTTTARRSQFETYAQTILDQRKNIVWTGGCTLDGIDYEFCRLNRRVNFEVNNGSGGTVSTGWDTIDAYVTDVDYDYAARTTTLTFSSDALALFGLDAEQLKLMLGIKALEQRAQYELSFVWKPFVSYKGYTMNQITGAVMTESFYYVDPETGAIG